MLQSFENRMSALIASAMAGAMITDIANFAAITVSGNPHGTIFGADYYSGGIIGGLAAVTCAMVSIESESTANLAQYVIGSVLWTMAVYFLNVFLGWTSHGLDLLSIIFAVLFGTLIGTTSFWAASWRTLPLLRSPAHWSTSFAVAAAIALIGANTVMWGARGSSLFGNLWLALLFRTILTIGFAHAATPKRSTILGSAIAGTLGMLSLYVFGVMLMPGAHLSIVTAALSAGYGALAGWYAFFIEHSSEQGSCSS